jgi:hypothetical protein
MKAARWIPVVAALLFVSCSGDTESTGDAGERSAPVSTQEKQAPDHGDRVDLGTLTVAGREFGIIRLGEIGPGEEGAFEVHPENVSADDLARLNLYLWVEDKEGTQVSAPSKGVRDGSGLHFHVTPRDSGSAPVRVVLRLRADGIDARAGLPLDDHGHEHKDGPHAGIPATFAGGGILGHLELKLHEDLGDLELWLSHDEHFSKTFDLPLSSEIEIEFIDLGGRKIALRPRNQEENEDESGKPNVRDGRTNYFVYPSVAAEDASWLRGKTFQSIVVVRFARDGTEFVSEEFVVKPHAH